MRINELEFQDTNGNEINPTKEQMATFIADLNNKNKQLEHDLAVRDKALKHFAHRVELLLSANARITGNEYEYISVETRIKNVLEKAEKMLIKEKKWINYQFLQWYF